MHGGTILQLIRDNKALCPEPITQIVSTAHLCFPATGTEAASPALLHSRPSTLLLAGAEKWQTRTWEIIKHADFFPPFFKKIRTVPK